MEQKQSGSYGWVVTFSGTAINLALGALYAWSVFKKPLESAFGLNDKQSALPYSVAIVVFALMMVPAGKLQYKIGPRFVAMAGGILVCIGFLISSFATPANAMVMLVIGFGALAGAGIGFGYASATPPAVKWFSPAKKGLIVGLVVGGFGLASVYVSPLTTSLIASKAPAAPKVLSVEEAKTSAEHTRLLLVELKTEEIAGAKGVSTEEARKAAEPVVANELKEATDAKAKAALRPTLNEQMGRLKTYFADTKTANKKAADKKAAAAKAATDALVLAKAGEIRKVENISMAAAMKKAAPLVAAKARENAQKNIAAAAFAFKTLAIIFGIAVILFSQFLKNPPAGYKPAGAVAANPGKAAGADYSAGAMLKTPQFYLIWLMFVFGAGAGLMVIGMIGKLTKELFDAKVIALAGFVFVAILAVGNASGRIIAGTLSDRIGRTRTMLIVFLAQAVVLALFPRFGSTSAFVAGALLVGFDYGACLSLFPSITADYYGLKNLGVNYGLVFTAWGVGGLIMPTYIAGTINVATGYYDLSFFVAAALCVVAAALTFLVKPPMVKAKA